MRNCEEGKQRDGSTLKIPRSTIRSIAHDFYHDGTADRLMEKIATSIMRI